MNNVDSDLIKTTYGVPQGSVLGPKLFILYINDVCKALPQLKCVLFADDTSLHCSGKDLRQLLQTVQRELDILKSWFDVNKLSLNHSKTKYIIFSNKRIITPVKLAIKGIEIEQVYEHNFLGVTIDSGLSWKQHIDNTKRKLSKSIAILHKMKYIVNTNSLYILYCSLILPYLTYCVEVWGNTFKTIIKSIYMLQKKAIRIINQSDHIASTNPLFIKSNSLKLEDLVNLNIAVIMYKAHNKMLPACMQALFEQRESKYPLRGTALFKIQTRRTNTKGRCLSIKGVKLWNNLVTELKTCTTLTKFKKMFKNQVLNTYKTST